MVKHADCVVGVVHNLSPEWLMEDMLYDGIDLTYQDCMEEYADDPDAENICAEIDQSDYAYGLNEEVCSVEIPDLPLAEIKDPDAEYVAISREINTQVLWSKWALRVQLCSLCYPGQGNLDSPGDQVWAYCPPPAVWGDNCPKGIVAIEGEAVCHSTNHSKTVCCGPLWQCEKCREWFCQNENPTGRIPLCDGCKEV